MSKSLNDERGRMANGKEFYGLCGDCDWMGSKRATYEMAKQDVDTHEKNHPGHHATVMS